MEAGASSNVSKPGCRMPIPVLRQVKQALANLNPGDVRESAMKPVRVGLVAASHESITGMETYLVPPHLSAQRRVEALQMLQLGHGEVCDVVIYEASLRRAARGFSFDFDDPEDCLKRILRQRDDLLLPLALQF